MTRPGRGERPYFVDAPAPPGTVAVTDPGRPAWLTAVAVLIAMFAAYYLAVFYSGPRGSSRHSFDHGRQVWLEHQRAEPSPAPSPTH